ncbi:60S ribosomal protein L31 [Candidatus Woesearchaeota archaeon]|nr:60S ribosomal protein L31 [Candidatus Woesearchaeota archaeon]
MERSYVIPLRKEFQKAPPYKRAKKAGYALREFLQHHLKTDKVLIGKYLNLKIWERGIKNPPHHVKVNVIKDEQGVARAELEGHPVIPVKKVKQEKKKAEPKKASEPKAEATKDAPATSPSQPTQSTTTEPAAEPKPKKAKVVKKEEA